MAEAQTYEGSCHCGKVRYEAKADLSSLIDCNCSMCSRKGAVMTFVSTDAFTLKAGEGATTEYQFNTKNIHHRFCSTCGIHAYAKGKKPDGTSMVMINVRCLEGVDVFALQPKHVDGKSR